jgi:hypothetical protein
MVDCALETDKRRWKINVDECNRSVCQPYSHQSGELWTILKNQLSDETQPNRLTMFNGGCFKFGYSVWEQVKLARLKDIVAGYPLYDNEIALSSEGVRFFIEIDYRTPVVVDLPSRNQLLADAVLVQRVLKGLLPNLDWSCVFLDCQVKMKTDKIIAIGSHLIFSNVVVDSPTGAKLCEFIQKSTNLSVDSAPYRSASVSLRPAFSRKLGVCPDCRGLTGLQPDCVMCKGVGKMGQGSYYTPRKVLTKEGRVKDYTSEDTSIIPVTTGLFTNLY